MIKIHWQILEEEGRSIKAIADLTLLPCTFIAKCGHPPSNLQAENGSIWSVQQLQGLSKTNTQLRKCFGESQREQRQIGGLLEVYNCKVKQKMRMPILQYYQTYRPPLPRELLAHKFREMREGMRVIQDLVANRRNTFLCGEQVTAIDVLLFFDVCNVFYFGKTHALYPKLKEWFQAMYRIRTIRTITHQWFSMAKQILRSLRPPRSKSKL